MIEMSGDDWQFANLFDEVKFNQQDCWNAAQDYVNCNNTTINCGVVTINWVQELLADSISSITIAFRNKHYPYFESFTKKWWEHRKGEMIKKKNKIREKGNSLPGVRLLVSASYGPWGQ